MKRRIYFIFLLLLSVSFLSAAEYIHHELEINLEPEAQFLKVIDHVTLPANAINQDIYFILHGNLKLDAAASASGIQKVDSEATAEYFGITDDKFNLPENIPYQLYKINGLSATDNTDQITIAYEGKIHHPVEQITKEYARGFSETPGTISNEGVYLAGSTFWLPWFNDELTTFNMTVSTQPEWRVLSQGKKSSEDIATEAYKIRWESPEPMDEVFLIAAKFTEYSKKIGKVNVLAYLRTADESLANKYLETTSQYLEMYRQLIGPYPYSKFALVENFWETGYGMPSFTLLGEKVIRFPFILHSSYPHELLHNWWGNSVFVDYDNGNWCEGITVFMADHLIKEQRGQGAEYRRGALQAFTDYVNDDNDFPVSEFISRHDAPSSSIGYNKSMMIFNMLRQDVGDDAFKQSIQKFYKDNKFRRAGFADIRRSFEETTGNDYKSFFEQWVESKGAPVLAVSDAAVAKKEDGYHLSFKLNQSQKGQIYQLKIPVAVYLENEDKATIAIVELNEEENQYNLIYKNRPLGIDVDPQFDVFRRLHRNEIPPSLSQVFGSEKVTIVLSSEETPDRLLAYEKLAQNWSETEPDKIEIIADKDLESLPTDKAIWLFGIKNKFKSVVIEGLGNYDTEINEDQYKIGKSSTSPLTNSVILSTRNPENPDNVIVWVTADNNEALPGLGRKLPHYGKYSYLAFEGKEPTNILKGQWPAINSPMSAAISYQDKDVTGIELGKLPARNALATLAPVFSEERLLAHVQYLAGEELKGRGLGTAELDMAADYIATEFKKSGLQPGGDNNSFFQEWQTKSGPENKEMSIKNIIGVIPGKMNEWKDQSVIVCAHYDHLGLGWPDVRKGNEGKIHPGADDNASGVSVLLELAYLYAKGAPPDRTIVFVAFSGEESGLLGSKYYVKSMKIYPADKIIGAINLDTVGRLNKNKILILNSSSASEWKHIAMGIGFVTGIGYELVSQDLDASDQVSFINAGVPAIQIFSGPNRDYHRPSDTVDKIDATGMVQVATFSREAVSYLTERENPMTFTGGKSAAKMPAAAGGSRKVGTGVMPDFAFKGEGVRAGEVAEDSPAANAGIQKGDVIIQLGDTKVANLKEYSAALKTYKPGDTTSIKYIHEEKEVTSKITLKAR